MHSKIHKTINSGTRTQGDIHLLCARIGFRWQCTAAMSPSFFRDIFFATLSAVLVFIMEILSIALHEKKTVEWSNYFIDNKNM